jgi:hypothetical protein
MVVSGHCREGEVCVGWEIALQAGRLRGKSGNAGTVATVVALLSVRPGSDELAGCPPTCDAP